MARDVDWVMHGPRFPIPLEPKPLTLLLVLHLRASSLTTKEFAASVSTTAANWASIPINIPVAQTIALGLGARLLI